MSRSLRCLNCRAQNDAAREWCTECGDTLAFAEPVAAEPAEQAREPSVSPPAAVRSAVAGSRGPYCECDPARRSAGRASCFICDRPYLPEAVPARAASAECRVAVVLPEDEVIEVGAGLLLGREVDSAHPALARAIAGRTGVSRVHAWIGCHDGEVTVLDLGSRNGTWIAGHRQPAGMPWRCADESLPASIYLGGSFHLTLRREENS